MATLVQQTTELFADNTSSIAPSITGVTAGNLVVMLVACSQSGTNTALTAPAGWSTAVSTTGPGSGTFRQQVAAFYKENAASGSHSGTVTFATNSFAAAVIVEFSGVKTTSSLDATNSSLATATTSGSTGNASNTTTNALVLAISCVSSDAGAMTGLSSPASSGYTNIDGELNEATHTGYQFSYKNVSSVASQSGSWTWTNNANCAGAVVIFGDAGTAPVITAQPVQQTVASGATATFSVTATDATSYQWQINSSGTWTNVSTGTGGTTSSYTTGTLGTSDIGNLYRCQVTNASGTTNSAEVFVFLTNQPSAGKGERGYGSKWSQRTTRKFGSIKTNGPASIRARARRGPNKDNNNLVTAWFNWFIPQPASTNPTGTLSVTLSNATLSSSGTTTIVGTLSRTISGDTLSASGTTTIRGTLSRTLSNDTLAASGSPVIVGTLAITLNNDTLSASGSIGSPVTGTVAVTLGNDTLSSSGTTTIVGTFSRTLSNDTLSSQGTTTVLGTLAKTLLDDTLAAAGSIGSAVSGTLNVTLNSDTLAGQGTTIVIGSLSRTLSNDTMTGSGSVTVTGTLSVTLQNDTLTASGSSGTPVTGVATKLPMTGVGS